VAGMKVKLHAILTFKEILGARETEIFLPEGATIQGLLSRMNEVWGDRLSSHLFHPGTGRLLPRITLMVNGRSVQFLSGMETALHDGDEVLLLPPVGGG
jgi:sulfur-carrier protein